MTTATVKLHTGEVLRGLPLHEAGDIVSAGQGVIIETTTTTPPAPAAVEAVVRDVPKARVTATPKTGGRHK